MKNIIYILLGIAFLSFMIFLIEKNDRKENINTLTTNQIKNIYKIGYIDGVLDILKNRTYEQKLYLKDSIRLDSFIKINSCKYKSLNTNLERW